MSQPDTQPSTRDELVELTALADQFDQRTADNAEETVEPAYPNLDAWMQEFFAHAMERRIATPREGHGAQWCEQYWAHPEALNRLYALWRAWECLRLDPTTGMSVWWRDHADPHWAIITHPDGPFRYCKNGRHRDPAPLPLQNAPADVLALLPDADEQQSEPEVGSRAAENGEVL